MLYKGKRVLVGFSGGVDSAMAALLLREQGCLVSAAMMSVKGEASASHSGYGCGEKEDRAAAKALADQIGVPLSIVDCSASYHQLVLEYFRQEYLAGRTPNPCVRCNPLIKFGILPALAREQGGEFDYFSTGHYARTAFDPESNCHILLRGVDHGKDQSYFLYRLAEKQLSQTLFPLGEMRKTEVRAMARERGLPVHDKPDSQDFYTGDYAELIGTAPRAGHIVDAKGKILGSHSGYWNFTPGQRKGLGVAFSEPLYVLRVDPERNEVVAGIRSEQLRDSCSVEDLCFNQAEPLPGVVVQGRMRSSQPLQEMTVGKKDAAGRLALHFARPQQGVAPGQSLVLYRGETVLGGGIIAADGTR